MDTAFWSASKLIRALRAKKIGALELLDSTPRVSRAMTALEFALRARFRRGDENARAASIAHPGARVRNRPARRRADDGEGILRHRRPSHHLGRSPSTRTRAQRRMPLAVDRFLRAGAKCSASPTCPRCSPTGKRSTRSTARRRIPGMRRARPADHPAARRRRSRRGLTGLEAGSDIGGSIRNPANYCGVYGHKPTLGICSMAGHALPGTRIRPTFRSSARWRAAPSTRNRAGHHGGAG